MFSAGTMQLRSIPKLAAGLALALCAHSSSYGQSATASTSSEASERIDEVWQKASSKYDGRRAELLKDVENADREGRYRADWESLKNYEVPEWYKDAKFGIFDLQLRATHFTSSDLRGQQVAKLWCVRWQQSSGANQWRQ